jgi:hypothetical protein
LKLFFPCDLASLRLCVKKFMKTPRDILFARHQNTSPKLDAIRQSTVAAVCDRRASTNDARERRSQTAATRILQTFWRELIFPCRRIWTGLAAAWILILIVNVSQRDGSQLMMAKSAPTAEMMMTFRDQQKLLNELLADRSPPMDAGRPRIFSPKPRTETTELLTA